VRGAGSLVFICSIFFFSLCSTCIPCLFSPLRHCISASSFITVSISTYMHIHFTHHTPHTTYYNYPTTIELVSWFCPSLFSLSLPCIRVPQYPCAHALISSVILVFEFVKLTLLSDSFFLLQVGLALLDGYSTIISHHIIPYAHFIVVRSFSTPFASWFRRLLVVYHSGMEMTTFLEVISRA